MWKLIHWIFGYDYIYWANTADNGIARVCVDSLGNPYYFRYRMTGLIDKITDPDKVMWLTCHPDKYAPSIAYETNPRKEILK
jgi:hypothetical protein